MGDLGFNQAIGQKEADVGAANPDPEMEIRQADFVEISQSVNYPEMKMGALQA